MKVVHIIAKDSGGAARAALRIDKALNSVGVDSSILVLHKSTKNDHIFEIISSSSIWNFYRIIRRIGTAQLKKNGLLGRFYDGKIGMPISKIKEVKDADIIHFHWINDGMISYNEINQLGKSGKKIVWTMHDMYPFTAGCYYDEECGKYETGCKECPLAKKNKVKQYIENIYKRKLDIYKNIDISFVGCSEWITKCAKNSLLTQGKIVCTIPNPIETDVFVRKDKESSMKKFGICTNKKILLFGAMSSDSDPRKGFIYLKKALNYLDPEKYILIVFGNKEKLTIDMRFETVSIGNITSDIKLAELYSIADIFIAPSTQENLSNAVMEALSCGTPVVAFDVGGMKDMINHLTTGYLAKPKSAEDLARGIEYAAFSADITNFAVRQSIVDKFSLKIIGKRYKEYYNKLSTYKNDLL